MNNIRFIYKYCVLFIPYPHMYHIYNNIYVQNNKYIISTDKTGCHSGSKYSVYSFGNYKEFKADPKQ